MKLCFFLTLFNFNFVVSLRMRKKTKQKVFSRKSTSHHKLWIVSVYCSSKVWVSADIDGHGRSGGVVGSYGDSGGCCCSTFIGIYHTHFTQFQLFGVHGWMWGWMVRRGNIIRLFVLCIVLRKNKHCVPGRNSAHTYMCDRVAISILGS